MKARIDRVSEIVENLGIGGMQFVQSGDLFKFGTDAVLLARYCRLKKRANVCDLGSGTGILPVLLCAYFPEITVCGVEIQERAAALARKNIKLNSLESRAKILCGDLCDYKKLLPAEGFDAVVSNPPYLPLGTGKKSPVEAEAAARSEVFCTIEDVCRAASWLLHTGGSFFTVYRPDRLPALFEAMTAAGIEPKRLRACHPKADRPPSLILCEGRRGGAPGLKFEQPLIINQDGVYDAGRK